MTRLLLFIILCFLVYTFISALRRALSPPAGRPPEKTLRGEDMVQDPVCGVYLPRGDALEKTVRGERHYFCSEECRSAFGRRQ